MIHVIDDNSKSTPKKISSTTSNYNQFKLFKKFLYNISTVYARIWVILILIDTN